jgi:hypothetical protein
MRRPKEGEIAQNTKEGYMRLYGLQFWAFLDIIFLEAVRRFRCHSSPPYFFDFLTNQTLTKHETSSNQSTHPVSFTPFLSNTS